MSIIKHLSPSPSNAIPRSHLFCFTDAIKSSKFFGSLGLGWWFGKFPSISQYKSIISIPSFLYAFSATGPATPFPASIAIFKFLLIFISCKRSLRYLSSICISLYFDGISLYSLFDFILTTLSYIFWISSPAKYRSGVGTWPISTTSFPHFRSPDINDFEIAELDILPSLPTTILSFPVLYISHNAFAIKLTESNDNSFS